MPYSKLNVWVLGAAVLLSLGLVGCTTTEGASGDVSLTEEEIIQLEIAAAGESQRSILADGIVTVAERERAYLDFIACAAEHGVEVYNYTLKSHDGDSYSTRAMDGSSESLPTPPAGHKDDEIFEMPLSEQDLIVDECRSEHYSVIGVVYGYQHRRTAAELVQFDADVAQCMRDEGAGVPQGATQDQMSDIDFGLYSSCYATLDK